MIHYDNMIPFFPPVAKDVFGIVRPAFSPEAAAMSACLCRDTYALDLSEWLDCGWMDVTIQADGKLTALGEDSSNIFSRISDKLKLMRIKGQMSETNAAAQINIALQQVEESKAGKVIVMIHPAANGRFVVAISFMGTGRRLADWFPNLRVGCEDGFHQGFLQLSRLFESNEASIFFPKTAEMLGLQTLSLADIVKEMRKPDSRFTMWLTGHSLGGALLQMYAYHKICEDDVQKSLINGYGFASPAVAKTGAVEAPAEFPLYHIMSGDDIIPRVGAQVHLGECLRYNVGEKMRSDCYAYSMGENNKRYRRAMNVYLSEITDMSSCLVFLAAYLAVLATRPHDEIVEHISLFSRNIGDGIRRILANADQSVEKFLNFALKKVNEAHMDIFDSQIDLEKLAKTTLKLREDVDKYGMLRLTEALSDMVNEAHRIYRWKKSDKESAYMYIAERILQGAAVVPGIWVSDNGKPRQIWADGVMLDEHSNNGHRLMSARKQTSNRLYGYSSTKSRSRQLL